MKCFSSKLSGFLIAAISAFSFSACDESSTAEDTDCLLGAEENECELNTARCSSGNTEICQPDEFNCSKWKVDPGNIMDCQTCSNSCVANSVQCSGNERQECVMGESGCTEWRTVESCPIACENNQCVSSQTTCTVGAVQCNGKDRQECTMGNDGIPAWMTVESCPVACDNNQCVSCLNACTNGAKQCSGNTVQTCQIAASGCTEWVNGETCTVSCAGGECQACPTSCTPDTYKCNGLTLTKCEQQGECTAWKTVKKCEAYCKAEYKTCTEDLPTCLMKPQSKGTILQWTDGDTLWVRAKTDGTCNDYEYTADSKGVYAWRNVRFDVRVEGIDAPECRKAQNSYYYYTCVKSDAYNDENERMGYESWDAAQKLLPYNSEIIISCEKTLSDGSCGYDTTRKRKLAYIGYERNNASYDFSTEIARQGLAFANTEFSKTTSKMGAICKAQKEAMDAKIGLWSLADTVSGVLSQMGDSKQYNLKYLESDCNKLIK